MICTTLCYLEREKKYLMLYRNKKKVDMNHGKWIGVGGHIEEGETHIETAIRECFEETGVLYIKMIFNLKQVQFV